MNVKKRRMTTIEEDIDEVLRQSKEIYHLTKVKWESNKEVKEQIVVPETKICMMD